jgi:hypothetical protein
MKTDRAERRPPAAGNDISPPILKAVGRQRDSEPGPEDLLQRAFDTSAANFLVPWARRGQLMGASTGREHQAVTMSAAQGQPARMLSWRWRPPRGQPGAVCRMG